MPITKYIKGNLLDHDGPIAHGVNCQGKMRSGVAKDIREKYPQHYRDYIDHLSSIDQKYLFGGGEVVFTRLEDKEVPTVLGIFSQSNYGYDGGRYVNYSFVSSGFSLIDYSAYEGGWDNFVLGIPKIGAGLGGGDWNIIEQIINDATPNLEIWVYEL